MTQVIDSYRIPQPYGRDLDPEANWLGSFTGDVQIWTTWRLFDGTEVTCHRPLNRTEIAAVQVFLERAKYNGDGDGVGVQLVQGYDLGEVTTPRYVTLNEIAELYIEVRG